MYRPHVLLVTTLVIVQACVPAATGSLAVVRVHSSTAAYPSLSKVYECAPAGTAIEISDAVSADLGLRVGEPPHLTTRAYQIGVEDLLVVVNPQSGIGALTQDQVADVFAGQIANWRALQGADLPVQVWTYSAGEDVQQLFDRLVMQGRPVTSLARLAVTAHQMSDSVGSIAGSVGLLPRRWKTDNTLEAFSLPSLPVLATVDSAPNGALRELLSCLQSR
jgi:phosphate transport system substrate-binding protein